jgi:hypothetical protein
MRLWEHLSKTTPLSLVLINHFTMLCYSPKTPPNKTVDKYC